MPTAPSFQSYKFLSEPFTKNGKLYITVEHPSTHNHRDVRWYSEAEYAKQYGKTTGASEQGGRRFPGLREARGFTNGPILLIRNTKPSDEPWLYQSCARYATDVGWYIASTDILPLDWPSHFQFLSLSFAEFTDGDEEIMKGEKELAKIISEKIAKKEFLPICPLNNFSN